MPIWTSAQNTAQIERMATSGASTTALENLNESESITTLNQTSGHILTLLQFVRYRRKILYKTST